MVEGIYGTHPSLHSQDMVEYLQLDNRNQSSNRDPFSAAMDARVAGQTAGNDAIVMMDAHI